MTYAEKLQSPKWQKKRLEVFQRDNFTCQHCGDTESTLHVHHLSYQPKTQPWDYPMENFQTLCRWCHEIAGIVSDSGMEIFSVSKRIIHNETLTFFIVHAGDHNKKGFYIFDIKDDELVYKWSLTEGLVELLHSKIKQNG
jgi:hypothetical protein